MNQMYGVKKSMVRKFIVQETGTYNDQFRRPYNTNLDATMQRELIDIVAESPSVSPVSIAAVSTQFIKPSATPESMIIIPNGWGTKRLRFLLDIVSEDHIGNMTSEYVVGYTDVPGISVGLHLDPEMMFFINAISITKSTVSRTPLGNQTFNSLVDTSHILSDSQYIDTFSPNKTYGLMPENIFSRIDVLELNSSMQEMDANSFTMDTSSNINRSGIKSKRSNNIVPVYTAGIIDAYMKSVHDNPYDAGAARQYASTLVKSESARSDTFMRFLKERSGLTTNSMFKLRDLEAFDPNLRNVTVVVPVNAGYSNNLHQSGMTASWAGADMTTLFATSLSQSVPSYMLGYTINKIHLYSTNMDFSGVMNTNVVNLKSFNDGADMSQRVAAFVSKLENELLRGLTYNGQISYQLELNVDLLGETWIKISLNGEPPIDYVCPSFADGLMAPIVTQNEDIFNSIASDFDTVLTTLSQRTGNLGIQQNMYSGTI